MFMNWRMSDMGMRLDSETTRKVLEMCAEAKASIALDGEAICGPEMVEPGILIENGRVTLLVAVETKSEMNQRAWRARNRRMGAAWKAVRVALGVHLGALEPFARAYASGDGLWVKFVRLGGRSIDISNIAGATKGVEDAVAYLLGADDGDPRWHPSWDREPGGPVGVRVEIQISSLSKE
jgi:hypothetical protein